MKAYLQYSDEELASLVKRVNQFAYTEIFERYHAQLYTFALGRLDDIEESEDLVSDLFVAL